MKLKLLGRRIVLTRTHYAVVGLLVLLVFLVVAGLTIKTTPALSGTQWLVLTEQDLQQFGMTRGMTSNGTDCQTEEQTSINSLQVQYSFCNYTLNSLNNTELIVELREFTNLEDRNGAYQYDSQHLYSIQGLLSENDYGDLSRFRVNNVNDYGGNLNPPGVYFYHLWICKELYLVHITSAGSKDARAYIANIGRRILSKFG